jgi:type II secretory pathway pseudopilin PulG
MKIFKIALVVIVVIVVLLTSLVWYLGFFTNINVEDKLEGGYTLVGKEYIGTYAGSGKFMVEVDKELNNLGITSQKGFGVYYNDPKTVPADKCRSYVGDVLEEKYSGKIEELKLKGFKIDTIPLAKSIVAYFPIKSDLSYMIGPIKVYPEFTKFINENGYKVVTSIEIYDTSEKRIEYIMQYTK